MTVVEGVLGNPSRTAVRAAGVLIVAIPPGRLLHWPRRRGRRRDRGVLEQHRSDRRRGGEDCRRGRGAGGRRGSVHTEVGSVVAGADGRVRDDDIGAIAALHKAATACRAGSAEDLVGGAGQLEHSIRSDAVRGAQRRRGGLFVEHCLIGGACAGENVLRGVDLHARAVAVTDAAAAARGGGRANVIAVERTLAARVEVHVGRY